MGNILISWPNRVDTATLSGGNWTLPLTNLQNRDQWLVARSNGLSTSNTKFDIDFGAIRNVRAIALANHNLSQTATWRISLGTTAGSADIFTSNWQSIWSLTFDSDLMEWEDVSVWEGVVDQDYLNHPYLAVFVLPDWYNTRYMTVEIADASNTNGYVDIGRAYIGGGFTPKYNPEYGLQDSWEDKTEIVEMASGATHAVVNKRYRKVQFVLPWLSQTEAAIVHEIQRRQGVYGEILYIPDLSDQQLNQRYGMLGRLTEMSAIEYPFYNNRQSGFTIKEL